MAFSCSFPARLSAGILDFEQSVAILLLGDGNSADEVFPWGDRPGTECIQNWKSLKAVWYQGHIISDPSATGTQTPWSSLPVQQTILSLSFSNCFVFCASKDIKHNLFACFFCVNLTHRIHFRTSCSQNVFCWKMEKELSKQVFPFICSYCKWARCSPQPTPSPRHHEDIILQGIEMPLTETQSFLPMSTHQKGKASGTNHLSGVIFQAIQTQKV